MDARTTVIIPDTNDEVTLRDRDGARQTYLDECLRIAVWEVIYGSGRQRSIDELLTEGAQWRSE